jgi:cell division protein DivIC
MKLLDLLPEWSKNKYLLASLLFAVWITFFDDRDLITNIRHQQELRQLNKSKKHYSELILQTKQELNQLKEDPYMLEKYAREKYRMKKKNEDLFIVP